MACFQLVNCQDGVTVMWITDSILNPTLSIGQIISCNEVQGHCLEVQDTTIQPCTGTVVTGIFVWPGGCQECLTPLCACPQGSVEVTLPNGTKACRQETLSLAYPPNQIFGCEMVAAVIGCATCGSGGFVPNTSYNQYGAKVYQDISSNPWPVTLNVVTPCTAFNVIDNSTTPIIVTNSNASPLWGDGLSVSNGRHNNVAVWNHFWSPTSCAGNPLQGLYGFTHCLVVATTTTYYFAASGRSFQLKIDGNIAVSNLIGDPVGTDNLHIFPITLAPGNYILEMTGAERGSGVCNAVTFATIGFVWEIYAGPGLTAASLMAMTTTGQLGAVTIYSTLNESGNKFDYGNSVNGTNTFWNHYCPGSGVALDNCFANALNPSANPNIYVCHDFGYAPVSGCCYLLTNCDPSATPYQILTSTDLGAQIGNVITVMPSIAGTPDTPGCFIVSAGQCDGTEIPVIQIQSFGPAVNGGCAACTPKCYLLTDCTGVIPPFVVSTDLSTYGTGPISICPPNPGGRGNGTQSATCCLTLTDCCNPANQIKVPCAPNGLYINQVINIPSLGNTCWQVDSGAGCFVTGLPITPIIWANENVTVHQSCAESPCPNCNGTTTVVLTECTCFTISPAQSCTGAIPVPGIITASYVDCADCLPKCFFLQDCSNPSNTIITNTDLTNYLGLVIYIDGCPGTCWIVTTSTTCTGAVPVVVNTSFVDCNTCLGIPPPPPLELKPRAVKPGYYTAGCPPEYTEEVSCGFANAAYDKMVIARYGITMCCNEPIEKWDIKMQLLQLRAIYDPDLCKDTICKCLPPCGMVATLTTYDVYTNCNAPTGMSAVLTIPPTQCLAPSLGSMQSVITIP